MHERVAALGRRRRLLHRPPLPRRRSPGRGPRATATPPASRTINVTAEPGQAAPPARPDPGRPHASWRSARSAATAPSGWPAHCPPTAGWSRWSTSPRHAEVARAQHRPRRASTSSSRCGSARPWSRCPSSPTRTRPRSTWSSSTPTRPATRTTWSGRCRLTRAGQPDRRRQRGAGRPRWPTPPAPRRTSGAPGAALD